MEKFSKLCFFLFAVAILASLCACNLQDKPLPSVEMTTSTPTPTSEPMVSIPEETKLPTEVPADRTESYIIADESFEVYNEGNQLYHYIGQNQTVTVKDIGLEIHLPEEWIGQVEIIRNAQAKRVELYIGNTQLMQAYAEMSNEEIQEAYGWWDWVLRVLAIRKDDTATIEGLDQSKYSLYFGENEEYRFYFSTGEMHDMNCDTFMITREMMIRAQGQEYYDNLVGDLVCTEEQAKEILKVI